MAKPTPTPTPKLSDSQLVLLSAAAQREDGALLPLPKTLKAKGAALARVVTTLSGRGLIEERAVAADAPHWRRDAEDRPIGLFLTETGLKTLEPQADEQHGAEPSKARKRRAEATKSQQRPTAVIKRKAVGAEASIKRPSDSKQDVVLQMLRRQSGASIGDIAGKTGWQAHTVRGFLSAVVRKKLGLPLVSEKAKDGMRRYHIAAVAGRDG